MINKFIHGVFNWLWFSSSDPQKVGLTAKGYLTVIAGALIPALGLLHVNVGNLQINDIINSIAVVVTDVLLLIGSIGGTYGFIRKAYKSLTGQNPVITTQ
jgi:hypothetical protein